jgi:hypothetical protein
MVYTHSNQAPDVTITDAHLAIWQFVQYMLTTHHKRFGGMVNAPLYYEQHVMSCRVPLHCPACW